jgi:prephenate dehydrogenase
MKDNPLVNQRVAIVGLGLMGGSLAMALRGKCKAITALENDAATIQKARQMFIVDQISDSAADILPQADVIVLAAPVRTILALIPQLPDWHSGSPLVLDLGSTKTDICAAMEKLPARFRAVGGHPMCGKEFSSLAYADSRLYQLATFALCKLTSSDETAQSIAEEMVRAVGATPLWMDAQSHDQVVAATSHMPFLLANSLAAVIPEEASVLVGPGLRSTSRLAGTSLRMMRDVLLTNRSAVLGALAQLQTRLDYISTLLSSEQDEALMAALAEGETAYRQIVMKGGSA